jgi:hypothetical protein
MNIIGHEPHISRHMILANRAMCPGILLPDFAWGKLARLPRGSLKTPNTVQTQPIFKHDTILCCWAKPRSHPALLFHG